MSAAPENHCQSSSSARVEGSLWEGFVRSVRNNTLAEFLVQAVRVGGFIVLARALEPSDFGTFRILVAITMIALLTSEAGMPDALIQRRQLDYVHEATAWWLCAGIGLLLAAALYTGAPVIAHLMTMPKLAPRIRLLSLPMLFMATASTANARLRRRLKFGTLAAADILAELGFLVTALALLYYFKLPRWSLPGGLAAKLSVQATVIWSAAGYIPNGMPRISAARHLSRFAFSVWSGRAIATVSANADYFMIGRLLGSSTLGFYTISWDLLRFIPDRLYKVAGRVTFPTFCALEDRNSELGQAYLNFTLYISRMVLPIVACAAIAAPHLLSAIYGAQWVPAAVPLRMLSAGMALWGLRIAIGSIYYAKDHPSFDIYLHGVRLALIVVTVWSLAPWGLLGVSAGMSAVEAVISIGGEWLVCILIGLRPWRLAAATLPGLRVAALCAIATALGNGFATITGAHGLLALAAVGLPPALIFCWLEWRTFVSMLNQALKPGNARLVTEAI